MLRYFASGFIPAGAPWLLIVTYGVIVGIGAGVVYNTLLTAMQKYFPTKKRGHRVYLVHDGCLRILSVPDHQLYLDQLLAESDVCGTGNPGLCRRNDRRLLCKKTRLPVICRQSKLLVARLPLINRCSMNRIKCSKQNNIITSPLSMMLAVPGFMLINPQFVLLSEERLITGAQALTAIMLASVFQAVGRLLVPFLSDKLGRVKILLIIFACSALSILGLTFVKGMLYPVLFIALAFFYGGIMGIYPIPEFGLFWAQTRRHKLFFFVLIGFGTASILCPFWSEPSKEPRWVLLFLLRLPPAPIIGLVLVVLLRKYPHHETKPAHSAKTEKVNPNKKKDVSVTETSPSLHTLLQLRGFSYII